MYSLTDLFFWLTLLGVGASFFLAFYIPGRVVLANITIVHKNALHVFSVVVGIVLWAWQGYLLGLLHLRELSYLYLLIFAAVFFFKKYYRDIRFSFHSFRKINIFIVLIALLGIGSQLLPFLQMGQQTAHGVAIMNINSADHIWHAGITLDLVDHFPPNEPGMSGILLKDYHYWFNLATADIIRVFHLPLLLTQFWGMYPLASLLLLLVGYYFAKLIYDNKLFISLFLFFLFFSGDSVIWWLLFIQHQFIASVPSLINNGIKFTDTPAFAYSMLVGMTALYFVFQEKKQLSKKMIIVTAMLFGSMFEFKVYTGIVFMIGLGSLAVLSLFKKRFDIISLCILSAILGAFVFLPNKSASSGLFFLPFELPREFITQKILGTYDWELRWRIFQDHHNYIRLMQYGVYMSIFYLLVQFGIQVLGLIPFRKSLKILASERAVPLYMIIISGIILGFFFFQSVGGANIWEFLLPAGFILSLFTALLFTNLLEGKNKAVCLLVIIAVVVFVLPRWLVTTYDNVTSEYFSGFHGISNEEFASYRYLSQHVTKDDIVMVVNHPEQVVLSSYVKLFSGAQMYLSGEGTRQQVTTEIQKRRDLVELVKNGFNTNDFSLFTGERIHYLYYYGTTPLSISPQSKAHIVFHNKSATIIQIN